MAISAAVSALMHPLYFIDAFLWFGHFRFIQQVFTLLPHESSFERFLPGMILASILPVTGAVLVFRRSSRKSAHESEARALLSPVG